MKKEKVTKEQLDKELLEYMHSGSSFDEKEAAKLDDVITDYVAKCGCGECDK